MSREVRQFSVLPPGFPKWPWEFLSSGDFGSEVAYLELGSRAWLEWVASPYDQPQFADGLMFWERPSSEDARQGTGLQ